MTVREALESAGITLEEIGALEVAKLTHLEPAASGQRLTAIAEIGRYSYGYGDVNDLEIRVRNWED